MALDNTHRMKWNSSAKHYVRLRSQLKPINNWPKHISACFSQILQVIGKSSSQTRFNQSVESYHACRVSWEQCPAAAACRRNNDPCYNHLKEVVEWSINDPETSQEPCWFNLKLNQWTSFEVVAQRNSWQSHAGLEIFSTCPNHRNRFCNFTEESFKTKIGRKSGVWGYFKCSEIWPLRILRKPLLTF